MSEEKKDLQNKELKPIVKGTVVKQKPSMVQRAYNVFFKASPEEVLVGVFHKVVIPNLKYMVKDIWGKAGDMFLFGVDSVKSNREVKRDGSRYRDYQSYRSNGDKRKAFQNESSEPANGARVDDYKMLEYDLKEDVEDIVTELQEDIMEYGETTVARVLELSGITEIDPIHFNWGWENLDDIDMEMTRRGYWRIIFPKVVKL